MKILITGGLGFIGSHTVVCLQNAGFQVLVVDNLSNSSVEVQQRITAITNTPFEFTKLDLRDKQAVVSYFSANSDISGIIHFAASKSVGESVEDPLHYYENNINTLVYVLQECKKHNINNFIFSSSCTVYGEPDSLPITEHAPVKRAVSPYGNTKKMGEDILLDSTVAFNLNVVSLRYFNPIGAHESGLIGELPSGVPQNLVPFITQTAAGLRDQLKVFGNDYPTVDGSCVRDYIHVVDLAESHVTALQRLIDGKNLEKFEIFNVGTGQGTSVLEIIETFQKVTGTPLNYSIAPRRPGDVVAIYADTTKANTVLGWKARHTTAECLASAWNWEKKFRKMNS